MIVMIDHIDNTHIENMNMESHFSYWAVHNQRTPYRKILYGVGHDYGWSQYVNMTHISYNTI